MGCLPYRYLRESVSCLTCTVSELPARRNFKVSHFCGACLHLSTVNLTLGHINKYRTYRCGVPQLRIRFHRGQMLTVSLAERALYAFVFVSIVSHFVYARWIRRWSRVHHPPGPSPLPLLGNVYQLPDGHKERTMSDWAVVFGQCRAFYSSFR